MLTFQEMIFQLTQFWAEQGCLVHQGYDLEVGAGTFNPATFLRCLGPEPYAAVYVEPSRRPKDGRYGENPNRVQFYHQMQVILKPSPENLQELYLASLEHIGLDLKEHDIRFVHDDWENPTIGAWGLGWEVWADGMEVTQFTYFQAVGGIPVNPVSGEITYGLERLALYIQGVDSFFDLKWNDQILYGDLFKRSEWEWSHYNFTEADAQMWLRHFEDFEREAKRLIGNHLPIPAYDFVMKASHAFNILDARGVISVTERTGYMGRIRNLARELAESYLHSREEQEFPLLRYDKKRPHLTLPPLPMKSDPKEKEDFLLEVGSEELPATFVPIGMRSLTELITHFLRDEGIGYKSIETFGTPRRLAVLVRGLVGGTEPQTIEKKGPAIEKAFDKGGKLTAAGKGFLRGLDLDGEAISKQEIADGNIASLEIRPIKGADYLFAKVTLPRKSTRKVLATALPELILKIDFPKRMRWSDLDIEYARPIRWIVALYGNEVIPFIVGATLSGHQSQGHRQLAPEPFTIDEPGEYAPQLKRHFVVASVEERRKMLLEQLVLIEEELKGKAVAQERVLSQVLHLVEWPYLTAATFETHFLQAPKEVLISEMVEHQKYFPVAKESGELLPHFIITCNNKPSELIRHGNQKALFPRLADGVFLYEEDLKTPLDTFAQRLKQITYQQALGSVWEKVERIQNNCELLLESLPICESKTLLRAATLCKADLATELVGEFPELQGTIGRIYAQKQNESEEVAIAIDEHWMPRGEKAPLPKSPCGILLGIADKIDNFLSCYSLGLKPTSSSDPYGLRRQAIGLLKSLIENRYHLPLIPLFEKAYDRFLQTPTRPKTLPEKEPLLQEIFHFLTNRLRGIFVDYGFGKDEIEAVLIHGFSDPYALYQRLDALHHFRKEKQKIVEALVEIHTRARKIILSQNITQLPAPDPAHLQEASEKALFEQIEKTKKALTSAEEDFAAILSHLAALQPSVSTFFEDVKVIADEPALRTNRLALLQAAQDLCEHIADFSKLQNS